MGEKSLGKKIGVDGMLAFVPPFQVCGEYHVVILLHNGLDL